MGIDTARFARWGEPSSARPIDRSGPSPLRGGAMTPFARILQTAVERTPGAVGGAFAASDGEMVDHVTTIDPTDWAILTAHYGVVLANMEAALNTKHFGGAQYFVVENSVVDVVVHTVLDGYFALLALARPTCLATALDAIGDAAMQLRKEMS
jgi:hypothetical protein